MSETGAAPRSDRNRTKATRIALLVGGLVVLGVVISATLRGRDEPLHYFTAKVQKGEIRDAVDATGTVSAVVTVQVGSQVSGTIARLNADFNTRVHKGDVIAVIDPQLLQGALKPATADLENARANVVVAEANLTKVKATEVQTRSEYERATSLVANRVGTEQALDLANANYRSAKASVDAAAANITQARAQVRQREAAVAVARTNLDYTVIRSPIDGTVVARNVDAGQTVAASLQAPTIFTIAQDLTMMQLHAKVDESDVGHIHSGQAVTFKVDAFPKELFKGVVSQVRMNPTTVQNVVTYDAIIDFENRDQKLFPGMTAYVTIPVAAADNVLKIPNAALRYKPPITPEEVRALYARYGIEESTPSDTDFTSQMQQPATTVTTARRQPRGDSVVVWKLLADGTIEPAQIALGITDHTYTEVTRVVNGRLRPGDDVVTTSVKSNNLGPAAQGIRR
jgi:HlyD family secretion protein